MHLIQDSKTSLFPFLSVNVSTPFSLLEKRNEKKERKRDLMTLIVMMWRLSRNGTPALGAEMGRVATDEHP